ncbi:hypothetical protein FE257_006221 [Aspergillus nanangensis]|uniref:Diacylglycerol O-acyltransferase n=1 Tax=Aspergillus nanangensis TaxID=2582783 RepID=A0AAD4GV17_ASPNN|nr:hypothetical protein FE257_006221 [Aspergillus nanangensis]
MTDQLTRVLFLANSEHGQTNIILAFTHELLIRGDIDVHIGSFPVLEARIEKLLNDNVACYDASFRSRIHFHPIRGPSNTDVFLRTGKRGAFHPPGYGGAVLGFQSLCEDIWGWTEDEYVDVYQSCVEIVRDVDPRVIAVDFFFLQGRDAAYNTGHTAILINTTSLSHIVLGLQPNAEPLWKYPLPGTGFPYPLPWHLAPFNALAGLKTAKMYHGSGRRREIRDWRIRHHIHGRFPFADAWRPDRFHLTPALKELDWPFAVPENILPCGPILLPTATVQDQDPEMARWLQQAPTVLVNLGTLYAPDPDVALNIAVGLKMFLDAWTGGPVQVLWKLPKHPNDGDDVYVRAVRPLAVEVEAGSVRICPWFQVEPLAMLETGHVACSVHHGGANSWYEAIQNGVPHVILPAWQDCYENAARAEWLDIGVYGNKRRAPNIDAGELSQALLKVMRNPRYKNKAVELSRLCHRKEGRVAGAEKIVEIAHHPEKMAIYQPPDDISESTAHSTGTLPLRSNRFRTSSLWQTYANYFPLTLHRTTPLSPRKKYIFGYHPHGVAFRGAMGAFAADPGGAFSSLFPGITNTLLVKDGFFMQPLLREYLLAMGVAGVSRMSCIRHLTRGGVDGQGMGRAITITVGGGREYRIARPGTMGIVVGVRRGFVRVAVETGAELVPVLAFGENELFESVDVTSTWWRRAVAGVWQWVVGHEVAFSKGRFGIFCPLRRPLDVVVGRPISVKQQRWEPEAAYIDQLHGEYVRELERLWKDWRGVFQVDANVEFRIVE